MVCFADTRLLHSAQIRALGAAIARRYKKQLPLELTGSAEFNVQLDLHGTDAVWAIAPQENDPRFLRFAARVSIAIQETLRAWLPYIWFSAIKRFDDFVTSATLLTYSSCRVFTPRNKRAYTFDVLDSDTPRAIRYSVGRSIAGTLGPIYSMLTQMKCESAVNYAPRHTERILAVYQRKQQPLNALLVAERNLVELYLTLPKMVADEEKTARHRRLIERRLRKLFAYQNFTCLGQLIEIEAMRAAAVALGQEPKFSAKIFANSFELPPLIEHEEGSVPAGNANFDPICVAL